MPNRLFIDEIVSVGAVAEGDNPGAQITFWKKKDRESHQMVENKGALMDNPTDETVEVEETPIEPELVEGSDLEATVAKQAEDLAKTKAELDVALAEIAKERKVRRDSEFIAKASELDFLGDKEEWGPVLDALEAGAPEAFGKLEQRLAAAKAQIETGDLFAEIGKSDGEVSDMDALVKAKRELHPDMTVAQARAEVWRENPELVEEARS
jgi:hypothetical protein